MKTGIYLIQNIKNGKCYVGQSKDIDKRIKEHKNAMCYKNENSKFNEDLKKYNICDFVFKILELCDIEELNEKEKYYSNLYDSIKNGYNFYECGNSKVPLKDEKIIRAVNIDEKTYKDFQIYAIMINKSVSSLIEQYMRETLKEMKKEK